MSIIVPVLQHSSLTGGTCFLSDVLLGQSSFTEEHVFMNNIEKALSVVEDNHLGLSCYAPMLHDNASKNYNVNSNIHEWHVP